MSNIELPGATPPPAPKLLGQIVVEVFDDGNFGLKLAMPHAAMAVEYLLKAAVYTLDKAKADAMTMVQAAPAGATVPRNGRLAN